MKKRTAAITAIILALALLASGCGNAAKDASTAALQSISNPTAQSPSNPASRSTSSNSASAQNQQSAKTQQSAGDQTQTADQTQPSTGDQTQTADQQSPAAAISPTRLSESVAKSINEGGMTYESVAMEAAADGYYESEDWVDYPDYNTEEYKAIEENGYHSAAVTPLSTFAADVDTAAYSNLRRFLEWGYAIEEIPSGAIRTEEMINYFSYDYQGPNDGEPFGVNAIIADCPWNPDHKVLMLGLQTEEIDFSETPDTNLVFLIDVSGSMDEDNKLPLLKEAFSMLAEQLGEKDRVSIVTYAGSDDVVLEGARGDQTDIIVSAINELDAYGSTNGGAGIITAYELAEKYYIEGGNNRVIIASDGDFNVGITSESDLYDLIRQEKEKGVFLSVLGFGTGNYSDARMETLADNGDGNYSYIDSVREAKKVLVDELSASLLTVAKDVKLQIEFNPAYVSEYRLIGYENRTMAAEDFSDDKKDGGEIGAGHSVTVLYELIPAPGSPSDSELKYQDQNLSDTAKSSGEWLTLSIRYKEPDADTSTLLEYPIAAESAGNDFAAVSPISMDDFLFATTVAEFSMVLTNSEYAGNASLRHIKDTLDTLNLSDEYRDGFVDMVYMVR